MKLTRLAAAFIAASTAITPLSLNTSAPISFAEDVSGVTQLPEWLPSDFDSALEFRNTYGAIHIDDGLICAVFQEQAETVPDGEPRGVLRYDVNTTKDMTQCLRHDIFASKNCAFNYEVIVYKPIMPGELEISFLDTWIKVNGEKKYTFSIDDSLNAVETDIYSWLPDCFEEYRNYSLTGHEIFAKDNYLMFCLDSTAGTPFDWYPTPSNDYDHSVIDYVMTEYCNEETAEILDSGEQYRIEVYQAKKDGMAKISYDYVANYGIPYLPEEVEKTMVADCAIINNAQNILLPGDMKVTIVDYDTGKPLTITENSMLSVWTDIRYYTPEGDMSTGPIYEIRTNPSVIDSIWNYSKADHFAFRLGDYGIPSGYAVPDNNGFVVYSKGCDLPDHITVTEYENCSADVVFKLKFTPTGDVNDDGEFNVADLVLFQKWLLGSADAKLINWKAADFCNNDVLNVFDLCLMRKTLFKTVNMPVAVSITETGGYEGVHRVWKVYKDNEKYILSYEDQKSFDNTETINVEISDADYREIMSLNYDRIIEEYINNSHEQVWDGFNYKTVLTYENGEEKETSADMSSVLVKLNKLLDKYHYSAYIEPEERTTYGSPFRVKVDDLKLYFGPDESYQTKAVIPEGTRLCELGYQTDNDKWLFTEYNGQYGWIRVFKEDDITPTIYFEEVADKPVIYLYPEQETDVHVELELTEAELSTTYPKYNNGWDVTAYPDGKLVNKADGTHHRYLFWDAVNCRTRFDFSKGFCVAGSDTESFLKEKLTYMGLTEDEMNEFIVYWLPLMEHNKYNLITFQSDAYTDSAKLNISPTPDSILRIFMVYVPLDDAIDIEPQQLSTFERTGFTVVEWGGSNIQ